jgi:molybdate transport system ATP-binding protein
VLFRSVYVSHQFEEVLQLATHVVLMENGHMLAQGDLPTISHKPALRRMIGPEAIGTVIDTHVDSIDGTQGLARITVGTGELKADAHSLRVGQRVRLQLLARDLILSLHAPTGLSVRNALQGHITQLRDDDHAVLADIDVGGVTLVSRITRAAAQELALHERMPIWVLVKAITLRGHLFNAGAHLPE